MGGTNDWLALANGIRMDDRHKWSNDWLDLANSIRMDDRDKWLISFG
jgi:hypothetical protein